MKLPMHDTTTHTETTTPAGIVCAETSLRRVFPDEATLHASAAATNTKAEKTLADLRRYLIRRNARRLFKVAQRLAPWLIVSFVLISAESDCTVSATWHFKQRFTLDTRAKTGSIRPSD